VRADWSKISLADREACWSNAPPARTIPVSNCIDERGVGGTLVSCRRRGKKSAGVRDAGFQCSHTANGPPSPAPIRPDRTRSACRPSVAVAVISIGTAALSARKKIGAKKDAARECEVKII